MITEWSVILVREERDDVGPGVLSSTSVGVSSSSGAGEELSSERASNTRREGRRSCSERRTDEDGAEADEPDGAIVNWEREREVSPRCVVRV